MFRLLESNLMDHSQFIVIIQSLISVDITADYPDGKWSHIFKCKCEFPSQWVCRLSKSYSPSYMLCISMDHKVKLHYIIFIRITKSKNVCKHVRVNAYITWLMVTRWLGMHIHIFLTKRFEMLQTCMYTKYSILRHPHFIF